MALMHTTTARPEAASITSPIYMAVQRLAGILSSPARRPTRWSWFSPKLLGPVSKLHPRCFRPFVVEILVSCLQGTTATATKKQEWRRTIVCVCTSVPPLYPRAWCLSKFLTQNPKRFRLHQAGASLHYYCVICNRRFCFCY